MVLNSGVSIRIIHCWYGYKQPMMRIRNRAPFTLNIHCFVRILWHKNIIDKADWLKC
jgi:hypothetical protein